MNSGEWHAMMSDLLQGIRLSLPESNAYTSVQKIDELEVELSAFVPCQEIFESKVESVISSDPIIAHAAEKYLKDQAEAAVTAALHLQEKAKRILKYGKQ